MCVFPKVLIIIMFMWGAKLALGGANPQKIFPLRAKMETRSLRYAHRFYISPPLNKILNTPLPPTHDWWQGELQYLLHPQQSRQPWPHLLQHLWRGLSPSCSDKILKSKRFLIFITKILYPWTEFNRIETYQMACFKYNNVPVIDIDKNSSYVVHSSVVPKTNLNWKEIKK